LLVYVFVAHGVVNVVDNVHSGYGTNGHPRNVYVILKKGAV
jgi:hypothetical protein